MCLCVRLHMCMHACMSACFHASMYVCTLYVCMHVCMHARSMYACMHVCMYICMYACMHDACMPIYMYAYMHVCMYVYTSSIYPALPGQSQHVILKKLLKFCLVGPLISFWQPKVLPVGVTNAKPYTLLCPYVVNNTHPVTWTLYAQFQPDWSINEFLTSIMMSYVCGNDQTTPIDTCTYY